MSNPAPGYKKYPKHQVSTRPSTEHVQVKYNGEVIADSRNVVCMDETHEGHVVAPVVYYFPRKDVKMDRLARTEHHTYCPFKGEASYYSLKGGPDNVVWSYEKPYDETMAIKDLVAFYPDKVEIVAK